MVFLRENICCCFVFKMNVKLIKYFSGGCGFKKNTHIYTGLSKKAIKS